MTSPLTTLRTLIAAMAVGLSALIASAGTPAFVNHGPASRFMDLDVHMLAGGSTVTQNYASAFSAISQIDLTMGAAMGAGATATLSFSDFIGLGVQANFLINNYRVNMAVADDDAISVANVFIRNHFYTFNVPVYISCRFNLAENVRWNVDGGLFYTYGLGGNGKTTIYSATINPMGQLVTTVTNNKNPYFNSSEAFINSSRRADIGLHMGTSLTFARKVNVGVISQVGFKNAAATYNSIVTPRLHNVNLLFTAGYIF